MNQSNLWLCSAIMLGLMLGSSAEAQTEWMVGDTQYMDYANQDRVRDSIDYSDTYINQAVTERLAKPIQRKTGGMEDKSEEEIDSLAPAENELPQAETSSEASTPEDDSADFILPDLSEVDFSQPDLVESPSEMPVQRPEPTPDKSGRKKQPTSAPKTAVHPTENPAMTAVEAESREIEDVFDFSSLEDVLDEEAPESPRTMHSSSPF